MQPYVLLIATSFVFFLLGKGLEKFSSRAINALTIMEGLHIMLDEWAAGYYCLSFVVRVPLCPSFT